MCVWPQRRDEKTATGTSNRQPLVSMSPLESTRMWGQCYDGGDNSRTKVQNVVTDSWATDLVLMMME